MTIPARAVLTDFEHRRSRDVIDGFLCERHGLLPCEPPLTALPESHAVWDEMAARMPEMFRSLVARETLDAMPALPAESDDLPGRYVQRACALIGMLAHTYVRVRPDPPDRLPPSITGPWEVLSRRLGRQTPALSYDDLISYNWRFRDTAAQESRTVEHMTLLFPTVGNREEHVFYLTQVEMEAEGAPLIGAMVRAQEAVVTDDPGALEVELAAMRDVLERVAFGSFLKIDPNPHSATHVDPVVWAKTVAPFAVSLSEGGHAISGAAAPLFQLLDVFLGRSHYKTRVGREALVVRNNYPVIVRAFIDGLRAVSVTEYLAQSGSRRLGGLWQSLLDAYVGDQGFLGVHRRKAYAFLEVAFKVGRSVTTGGFTGLFDDQTWEVAHEELENSRRERPDITVGGCPMARISSAVAGSLTCPGLVHLRLGLSDYGVRYLPGDRLTILPRNDPELVARTLRALRATGDELIALDGGWRQALAERGREDPPEGIALRELLVAGHIRPVSRGVAKALLARSQSERLGRIVNARAEGSWALWDLLALLGEGGFDTGQLWRADPWEPYSICKLVAPEDARPYSISSAMKADSSVTADQVELLVSELHYETPLSDVSPEARRAGTASAFLARLAGRSEEPERLSARVLAGPRFRLPDDRTRPIVMLAGGAGISAFRGFLAARLLGGSTGENLLLVTTRNERALELFHREMEPAVLAGVLTFDGEITGGAQRRSADGGIGALIERHRATLLSALRAGYDGPILYVCGPSGFAASVTQALEGLADNDGPPTDDGRAQIRRMIARGRLQYDVFTTPLAAIRDEPVFDASDVAFHTREEDGLWTIIDGGVYDLTEFSNRHPGGRAILVEVAGRDGTHAYRTIEHHVDAEIEAMLPMYRIGAIRRLDFGARGALTVGPAGFSYTQVGDLFRAWVRYLHFVVEIDNAVRHDFSVMDTVTVAGDNPSEPTMLKAQLLLETHKRLGAIYLVSLLGEDLTRLWELTVGFCAPGTDVRILEHALAGLSESAAAAAAVQRAAEASAALYALGRLSPYERAPALARITSLRGAVERVDLGFLAQLKVLIANGVRSFERWGRETPERAAADLMALNQLPSLVLAFHEGMNDALAGTPGGVLEQPRAEHC